MPVPQLHPHINVMGVIRDQATLWLLSGIVFTTSGVFIGLALRGGTSNFGDQKSPSSSYKQSSPFDNVGFTATVANSLFALIHLYCSTVPVLRDHATGLLEVRHVYFFGAVLGGFASCVGSAACFLFNWQVSLLLGYASATYGAVAAGQLAGAINPGVVVCRGGGVHTGVSNGLGHHYCGAPCGRAEKGRCRCGGTCSTVAESGSGNPRSTRTDGTGHTDQNPSSTTGTGPQSRGRPSNCLIDSARGQISPPKNGSEKGAPPEDHDGTQAAQVAEPHLEALAGPLTTVPSHNSHTGTVKHNKTKKTRTPVQSPHLAPCHGDACPGRLSSDGAAAAVDMQMGLTGVSIV